MMEFLDSVYMLPAPIVVGAIALAMIVGGLLVAAFGGRRERALRKLLERVWYSGSVPANSILERDVFDELFPWGGE